MLIVHPPLTKPCEPPAALAYLAASLQAHGHSCTICDMNIEGLHYLFDTAKPAEDTWSKRSFKNLKRNITALQTSETYNNTDRYRRAVADINRILEISGKEYDLKLSLANYQDNSRSPLKSGDLRLAAVEYEGNIFFSYFSRRLEELIETDHSGYIGFSLNYLSQAMCTFAMIGYLRAFHPEVKIILGGGLVTTWLSHPQWTNPFAGLVDHFIGGQGEGPLLNLLGTQQKPDHVRPTYDRLRSNGYLSPGFILPYASSFGCFWKKCSFCPETSEDNPYQHVTPSRTITDLQALVTTNSPSLIHLLDNAVSPATFKALTNTPPTVPWYGFARIDSLLADRDFCRQLKDSGCCMLKLGLESGDQEVLNSMHKGINLELATKVLENLHEVGIATYVYLLFGTPSESLREAERTLSFVEKHHQAINFLNLAIFNLPTCSEEVASLEVADFYEGDLSLYRSFTHPKGWNRGEVRRFLDSTFKRSTKIADILRQDPPFFTSNHAPFMKECQTLMAS
ncbi:MAG: radical SAM protein [Desulfobulbaceae bacterium]|nr:radical SAM protein [Desulfobulbaceae bacterium]